ALYEQERPLAAAPRSVVPPPVIAPAPPPKPPGLRARFARAFNAFIGYGAFPIAIVGGMRDGEFIRHRYSDHPLGLYAAALAIWYGGWKTESWWRGARNGMVAMFLWSLIVSEMRPWLRYEATPNDLWVYVFCAAVGGISG